MDEEVPFDCVPFVKPEELNRFPISQSNSDRATEMNRWNPNMFERETLSN
jgi:hypothetical protein